MISVSDVDLTWRHIIALLPAPETNKIECQRLFTHRFLSPSYDLVAVP
ncbi:MAG: hypothetical protein ACRYGK_12155 [Janthinobacterium lividum]